MSETTSARRAATAPPPTDDPAAAITIARGDGIGPEIMGAALRVLEAAHAPLVFEEIEIGERVYHRGVSSGIDPSAWDSLRRTRVFLKAPITTPQGGGYKSLNVTTRKTLGLYANVRPCRSYHPFIRTKHPGMDLVIIRENEEDTYAGIEHRQTEEVTQCLKLISRPGCEKIVRYAFDYALRSGRHKVTCMVKDNIMKITDGLFRRVFEEIAPEYPDIRTEVMIIDIGTARIADTPEWFDVIVTPNLYGDIISDVAAQLTGSVGMAGSANIGDSCAMFEAIHGSAPDIAGRGIANPSGLIQASVMMLVHLGFPVHAERIHNAWLRTIEEGIITGDVRSDDPAQQTVGTDDFADAVIKRLGRLPERLPVVRYQQAVPREPGKAGAQRTRSVKTLRGADIFLDWDREGRNPGPLGDALAALGNERLALNIITNRGVKVYPDGMPETFCTDHWRCRFLAPDGSELRHSDIIELLQRISAAGFDFIKTEHLYAFDGERGWSAGQGE